MAECAGLLANDVINLLCGIRKHTTNEMRLVHHEGCRIHLLLSSVCIFYNGGLWLDIIDFRNGHRLRNLNVCVRLTNHIVRGFCHRLLSDFLSDWSGDIGDIEFGLILFYLGKHWRQRRQTLGGFAGHFGHERLVDILIQVESLAAAVAT